MNHPHDMRRWRTLCEAKMSEPMNGVHRVWHASPQQIEVPRTGTHLGTQAAAEAIPLGRRFYLHEFEISVVKPVEISDSPTSYHNIAGMIEELETRLGLSFNAVDRALTRARQHGDEAGPIALRMLLKRRGIDFLYYTNRVEDVGSISWVVIDPSHVRLIDSRLIVSTTSPQRWSR